MTYHLRFQPPARRDLDEAYAWAARREPLHAARWFNRFEAAMATLLNNPDRCAFAIEHRKSELPLREFLFGKRPNVFRVIFIVDAEEVRSFASGAASVDS